MEKLTRKEQAATLVHALRCYPDEIDVLRDFCQCFRDLELFLRVEIHFAEAEIREALMHNIKRYPPSVELAHTAWILARTDSTKRWFLENDHIDFIVKWVMQIDQSNEDLLDQGCSFLRNLANDEDIPHKIGENGGLDYLYQILIKPDLSSKLVVSVGKALLNLTIDNTENRKFLSENKLATLCFARLATSSQDPEALEVHLSLLWEISMYSTTTENINLAAPYILAAMKDYPNHEELNVAALGCMTSMSTTAESCAKFVQLNSLDIVCKTLKRFPTNSTVMHFALSSLRNLTTDLEKEYVVLYAGKIVDLTISIMRTFSQDSQIQIPASVILSNLSEFDHIVVKIVNCKGVQLLCEALEFFYQEKEIQAQLLLSLCGIIWIPLAVKEFLAHDGMKKVLRSFNAFPEFVPEIVCKLAELLQPDCAENFHTPIFFDSVLNCLQHKELFYRSPSLRASATSSVSTNEMITNVSLMVEYFSSLPKNSEVLTYWNNHNISEFFYRAKLVYDDKDIQKSCKKLLQVFVGESWRQEMEEKTKILQLLLLAQKHDECSVLHHNYLPLDLFKLIIRFAHLNNFLPRTVTTFSFIPDTEEKNNKSVVNKTDQVVLLGKKACLGKMNPKKAVKMSTNDKIFPQWTCTVSLNPRRECIYRFGILKNNKHIRFLCEEQKFPPRLH